MRYGDGDGTPEVTEERWQAREEEIERMEARRLQRLEEIWNYGSGEDVPVASKPVGRIPGMQMKLFESEVA